MAQLPTLSTDDFPEKTNSDENGTLLETPYPGLNNSIHYDADEYNRLSGAVIAHRAAVNDLDGRVEALESGGSGGGSTEDWPVAFTNGSNVGAVTLVGATQRVDGDYVTLTGTLSVTPAVGGQVAVVNAVLPVVGDGSLVVGPASGFDYATGDVAKVATFVPSASTLSVVVDAETASEHMVGFSVQYKKAP